MVANYFTVTSTDILCSVWFLKIQNPKVQDLLILKGVNIRKDQRAILCVKI